ncbi:tyrosine-protein phosphatase non-receptor type 13-like isoform X3 [Convolutriloba macropyga]|uniref:tyrosine-protein phosphatase non-receptor type 13-like isoform X3 n=1 Tax=Convolutriloba macropyga TaxID=536237 RepID=UPI003F5274DF
MKREVAPDSWLSGQSPSSLKLFFLVRYYLGYDQTTIKEDCTRELLYWQVRRDVLAERLDCSLVESILLGVALHCENCDNNENFPDGINVHNYVPDRVIQEYGEQKILSELMLISKKYPEYDKTEAQNLFIREASKITTFGCFYYTVDESTNNISSIGVSSTGILGFRLGSHLIKETVFHYKWADIWKGQLTSDQMTLTLKGPEHDASNTRKPTLQDLEVNFGYEKYKIEYIVQLCNLLFKINYAINVQSLEEGPLEKLQKLKHVPNLFDESRLRDHFDKDSKRIRAVSDVRGKSIRNRNEMAEKLPKNTIDQPNFPKFYQTNSLQDNATNLNYMNSQLKPRIVSTFLISVPAGSHISHFLKFENIEEKLEDNNRSLKSIFIAKFSLRCKTLSKSSAENIVNIGDKVLAINGTSTEQMTLKDAEKMLTSLNNEVELVLSQGQRNSTDTRNITTKWSKKSKLREKRVFSYDFMESDPESPTKYEQKPNPKPAEESSLEISEKSVHYDSGFDGFECSPVFAEQKQIKNQQIERKELHSHPSKLGKNGKRSDNKESENSISPKENELAFSAHTPEDDVFMSPLLTPPTDKVHFRGQTIKQYNHGDIFKVDLQKVDGSVGIILCDNFQQSGIFVRSLTANGSADLDGHVKPGDRVCKIHGYSLKNSTLDNAIKVLENAPQVVRMEVERWVIPINEYRKSTIDYSSFVTDENIFRVVLSKEASRGDHEVDSLGIAMCGFVDAFCENENEKIPRIYQVHAGGPAQKTGLIKPGDVILSVNGFPMENSTYHDFVYLVRYANGRIKFKVCRPLPGILTPISNCQPRNRLNEQTLIAPKTPTYINTNVRSAETSISRFQVRIHKTANEALGIKIKTYKIDPEKCYTVVRSINPGSLTEKEGNLRPGDIIEQFTFDSPNFTLNRSKPILRESENWMQLIKISTGVLNLTVVRKHENFVHDNNCSQEEICACVINFLSKNCGVRNGFDGPSRETRK